MAYGLLKGKRGIITGALNDQSIAWKVAELAHAEGAKFVLSNAPVAMRMGEIHKLAEAVNSPIIGADATSDQDMDDLFRQSVQHLGGKVDFVLHSIGMSPNVRKGKAYDDLNYDWYKQTLDVSAMSFHRMLQSAQHMDALAEGGSVVALSYIAAQRVFPGLWRYGRREGLVGNHWKLGVLPRSGEEGPCEHRQPIAHDDHGRFGHQGL